MNRRGFGIKGSPGDRWKATWGQAGRRRAPGSQPSWQPRGWGPGPPTCPPSPHRLLGAPQGWSCICPRRRQPALPDPGGPTAGEEGGAGRGPARGRSGPSLPGSFPRDRPLHRSFRCFLKLLFRLWPRALPGCGGRPCLRAARGAAAWRPHILGGGPVGFGATHSSARRQLQAWFTQCGWARPGAPAGNPEVSEHHPLTPATHRLGQSAAP